LEGTFIPEIRVAIAGLGNCASALLQGLQYYKNVEEGSHIPGLMHANFGGYHIRDIKVVAAFEVNRLKIGKDISEAIFTKPNVCAKFADVPPLGVEVLPAPILDSVAPHMEEPFSVYDKNEVKVPDVARTLEESDAEILLNYIPVGSNEATKFYARACLKAGCAFINCIPEFIASDLAWAQEFRDAKLPVAGDDIKSQVGATILHRVLADLLVDRGVKIDETYQLNLGGDTDFLNMTVEERLSSKRISKTEAVTSLLPYKIPTRIGPSDYVPFLGDAKICYIHIRGRKFGDRPIKIDVKLSVEDSPNSAGVAIDLIRAVKLALDRGISGPLLSMSAYAFKHPPIQTDDDTARRWVEEYIQGKRDS